MAATDSRAKAARPGVHIEPRLFPVLVIAELADLLSPQAFDCAQIRQLGGLPISEIP